MLMRTLSSASRLRHRQSWLAAFSLLTLLLQGCSISSYEESLTDSPVPSLVRRHTLKELRDRYIVKQALDYSCGAAALATLLSFYYGDMTSEAEILTLLKEQLTPEELAIKAERGFSLLDLKKVAIKKGYRAEGIKLTPQQLIRLVAPVIVFVEPQGYKHFSVLRGTQNGMVYLADPSRGNLRMRIDQFAGQGNEWQEGIIFVLGKKGEEKTVARTLFPTLPFTDLQPQLIGIIDTLDQGRAIRDLPMR
jgi:predicted double-glycine peptidase